jgi:hypothetical protein
MTRSQRLTAATLISALVAAVVSVLPAPASAAPRVVRLPTVHVVGQRVAPAPSAASAKGAASQVVQLPRVEIVVTRRASEPARLADKSPTGERMRAPRG